MCKSWKNESLSNWPRLFWMIFISKVSTSFFQKQLNPGSFIIIFALIYVKFLFFFRINFIVVPDTFSSCRNFRNFNFNWNEKSYAIWVQLIKKIRIKIKFILGLFVLFAFLCFCFSMMARYSKQNKVNFIYIFIVVWWWFQLNLKYLKTSFSIYLLIRNWFLMFCFSFCSRFFGILSILV